MNIRDAKEEIKNAMVAYFSKDEFGNYEIPIEKQRPIFMIGAPGIGKTAIMEQIAQELGVGLVSYSMTHHTRQSALGLPFIEKKVYGGQEYNVSEYTMSEIIASVYEMMEMSGLKEGILFLDEINCVSETLAPSMLQFLQYKVFGCHRVPEGWIVVTAGNPPEYNNSVREFDIVTWDRLKRIDVEADYDVWKEYAMNKGVHPAVTTYLEIKKSDFYKIETTVNGKSFVTARGWSDLSDMIKLYEKHNIPVKQRLVEQYLQNKKIAKAFAIYYDLFNKYKSDYQVDQILAGKDTAEIRGRAVSARFDERLSLIGLLLDAVANGNRAVYVAEQAQLKLLEELKAVRTALSKAGEDALEVMNQRICKQQNLLNREKAAGTLSADEQQIRYTLLRCLEEEVTLLMGKQPKNGAEAFKLLKTDFDKRTKDLKTLVSATGDKMTNMFKFCEKVFDNGQEILIIVTELTISYYCAHFISRYGCEAYFRHNKDLLFYERQKEIIAEIEDLDWE